MESFILASNGETDTVMMFLPLSNNFISWRRRLCCLLRFDTTEARPIGLGISSPPPDLLPDELFDF